MSSINKGKSSTSLLIIDASETQYWDDAGGYDDPEDITSAGANQGWYPVGYGLPGGFNCLFTGSN